LLQTVRELVMNLPWGFTILFCLTMGLAPFVPVPHLWEKLKNALPRHTYPAHWLVWLFNARSTLAFTNFKNYFYFYGK